MRKGLFFKSGGGDVMFFKCRCQNEQRKKRRKLMLKRGN